MPQLRDSRCRLHGLRRWLAMLKLLLDSRRIEIVHTQKAGRQGRWRPYAGGHFGCWIPCHPETHPHAFEHRCSGCLWRSKYMIAHPDNQGRCRRFAAAGLQCFRQCRWRPRSARQEKCCFRPIHKRRIWWALPCGGRCNGCQLHDSHKFGGLLGAGPKAGVRAPAPGGCQRHFR